MPTTPEAGYTALLAADYIDGYKSDFEAELIARSLPANVNWERDAFMGISAAVIGVELGQLSQAMKLVIDTFSWNNAYGQLLDELLLLFTIPRKEKTPSVAICTLTGVNGTVIPAGTSKIRGGGSDGNALWSLETEVTIASGTGTGTFICDVDGETIAFAGDLNEIATPITGWTAVTNALDAVPGTALETDEEARIRGQQSQQTGNGPSAGSLRSSLLQISGVQEVVLLENDTMYPATVNGLLIPAKSFAPIIYPSTLTSEQKLDVAEVIYKQTIGIYVDGVDEEYTITDTAGDAKVIRWSYAEEVEVDVLASLTLDDGYSLGDVEDEVQANIEAYFDSLKVSKAARRLEINGVVDQVEGVVGLDLELDGVDADFLASGVEKLILGALTIEEA